MFTGPNIVTEGLVLALDAGNKKSYPGSGNTWYDLSGNGNNGTLTNMSATPLDSGNGGSLVFDGSNDRIDLGSVFSLQGSVNFTMEVFVKINSAGSDNAGIIESFSSSTNRWFWYYDGGSLNQFGFHNGSWNGILSSGISPTIGKWTHLLISRSGNTFKSYVDGNNVQTVTVSKSFPSSNNVRIGSNSNAGEYLNGNISFVKLYNRALTAEEVQQNYNATKSRFGLT